MQRSRGRGQGASRGTHRQGAARTRQAEAQTAAGEPAARRDRPPAREQRRLHVSGMRRQDGQPRRGRHRGPRLRAGPFPGHPPRPAQIRLRRVRRDHPGPGSADADPGAAALRPRRWRTCWWRNMPITCRCIARARCSPARGSTSTAPHCPTGLAKRHGCSIRWRRPSRVTCSRPRRSTATTPPCGCSRRALVGPGRDGSGFTCATTACCGHRRSGGGLFLQPRPRRPASGRPHGALHRIPSGRRLCRVRRLVQSGAKRAWPNHRSRLLGALPKKTLRCLGGDQVAGRPRGARPDRGTLRHRGQGPVRVCR